MGVPCQGSFSFSGTARGMKGLCRRQRGFRVGASALRGRCTYVFVFCLCVVLPAFITTERELWAGLKEQVWSESTPLPPNRSPPQLHITGGMKGGYARGGLEGGWLGGNKRGVRCRLRSDDEGRREEARTTSLVLTGGSGGLYPPDKFAECQPSG